MAQGFQIDDSELREYTHGMLGAIADALGKGFAPYMPHAVEAAFASCSQACCPCCCAILCMKACIEPLLSQSQLLNQVLYLPVRRHSSIWQEWPAYCWAGWTMHC